MSEYDKRADLLAQKLARKEPQLSQYALNENAEVLAILNWIASVKPDDSFLDIIRKYYEAIGSAKAVKKLDIVSKLGLRAGSSKVRTDAGELD